MNTPNVWLVRCGESGAVASTCISGSIIAIRSPFTGDASLHTSDELLQEINKSAERDHQRLTNELMAFANEIQVSDVVITPDKTRRRYFIGRVTSDYTWIEETPVLDAPHVRNVEWSNYLDWDAVPIEYKSIANYQKSVLLVNNPALEADCIQAANSEVPSSNLLASSPAKKATTARSPRKPAASRATTPPKPTPESQERLCSHCGLKKHIRQFSGSSTACVDCE